MTCCSHCEDAEDVFSRKIARGDLRRYRRRGPRKSTRLLLEALRAQGVAGRTLLDVGGGVGIIQHELMPDGLRQAVQVDASTAYLQASQKEAARRGHAGRVTYRHGDFVALAPTISEADVVTLDRVLCCYPEMPRLVEASAGRARHVYGLVYPREGWPARLALGAANLLFRLRRSAFRTYLHPTEAVEAEVRRQGFGRVAHMTTFLWQVSVYVRTGAAAA